MVKLAVEEVDNVAIRPLDSFFRWPYRYPEPTDRLGGVLIVETGVTMSVLASFSHKSSSSGTPRGDSSSYAGGGSTDCLRVEVVGRRLGPAMGSSGAGSVLGSGAVLPDNNR